jgi:hypothetical protein
VGGGEGGTAKDVDMYQVGFLEGSQVEGNDRYLPMTAKIYSFQVQVQRRGLDRKIDTVIK